MAREVATGRLRPLLKITYGLGGVAESIVTTVLTTFLLFYYTALLGLSGSLAGLAIFLGLVLDAVADPLMGSISDGWRSRLGRRHPFLLVGGPLVAIALALTFLAPAGLGTGGLFAWLLCSTMGLRLSMSLYHVPYTSLGAELSDDYTERTSIVSYRWIMWIGGGLLAVVLGYGVFFKSTPAQPQGQFNLAGYGPFAITCAAISLTASAVMIWGTWRARNTLHGVADDVARFSPGRFLGELREVAGNRSFRILFGGMVLFYIAQGVHGALGLHASTYFWQLSTGAIQLVTLSYFVGLLLGVPVMGVLGRRLEKRDCALLGLGILFVCQVGLSSLRLAGVITGHGAEIMWLVAANTAVAGVGISFAAIAVGSMMADVVDEHEGLYGGRQEGVYFGGLSFSSKAATGVGSLVAGVTLDLVGLSKTAHDASGHVISAIGRPVSIDTPVGQMGLMYGPGAALVSCGALLFLAAYRLNRKRHDEIMVELNGRRARRATPDAAPGAIADPDLLGGLAPAE